MNGSYLILEFPNLHSAPSRDQSHLINNEMDTGADPGFKKRGAQHIVFFSDRRQPRQSPSTVAQVPKKLMSGGGGNPTQYCVPTHFFFKGFKKGGGGTCTKRFQKGGHGPGVPPPP